MKPVTVTPIPVDQATADSITGRGDPQQRFRIYRLCECFACLGKGKTPPDPKTPPMGEWSPGAHIEYVQKRCEECRGEGKVLDLVATAADPQGVGVAIVELGREGEFAECPVGVLDTQGETGQKWLVSPWLPSPRNVSDAARVLARSKR